MVKKNLKKDEEKLFAEINIKVPLNLKEIGFCNPVEMQKGIENIIRQIGTNGLKMLQYAANEKTEIKITLPKL